jgi:ferredoxin
MAEDLSFTLSDEIEDLARGCRHCHQCGQCTSSCPSGWDLSRGPRLVVRLLLSGDVERILACEDIWRCCACGACSRACPMEIDIAGMLAKLRRIELAWGAQQCPEREATRVAIKHLSRRKHINTLLFGMAMAARGYLPRDVVGAAGAVSRIIGPTFSPGEAGSLEMMSDARKEAKPERKQHQGRADLALRTPFFAGCVLRQDRSNYRLILRTAAALSIPLEELDSGRCCGHPTRGAQGPAFPDVDGVLTVCPGCESSLAASGIEAKPLWEAFVEAAKRKGRTFSAKATAFVPYVGCMGDRDRALAGLADAATLAGIKAHITYPSRHAICCGALGSTYRGETKATLRLLDFAINRSAPIVTTCLLCRDNLRSAARKRYASLKVYFWPEFFHPTTKETP